MKDKKPAFDEKTRPLALHLRTITTTTLKHVEKETEEATHHESTYI